MEERVEYQIPKNEERERVVVLNNKVNISIILRLFILKSLSITPNLYGNEIYNELKDKLYKYRSPISYSVIYNTLHKLEEEGFVISSWDKKVSALNKSKRFYRITDEGLNYYKRKSPDVLNQLQKQNGLIDVFIKLI